MRLPEFSVNRKVTTTMIVMIIVVMGLIAFSKLGLDFFPSIDYPTVSVVTNYRGASSEDIEKTITKTLEQVISSVNRIKKVTSQTSEGTSIITAEFEWGTNLDFAAQDIRDQIGLYKYLLPKEASEPLVVKFNLNQMPIIFYGITANMPTFALKKLIEDEVGPRLERIDGVAAARAFASDTREILVDIDKNALESHNLSLDRVLLALQLENINMPAGNLVERHTDYLVRTLGEYKSLDEIRRTVVGSSSTGNSLYLQDIAEVKDTMKEVRYLGRIQQQKGVFLIINKRSGANTAITGRAVKKALAEIRKNLPPDIEFHVAMDQSAMIERVTKYTVNDAWMGGILAVILIFLFLRDWRPTLIIALAIPLSIITTFIAFYLAGYTLNLITLGGLALGIGRMVDDSIVVIENTFRHHEFGKSKKEAAITGASEVGMAVTASTLTTIVVFFPMVIATGITAKLTRGMALAIVFSLVSSLFVALTVVPMLASLLLKSKKEYHDSAKKQSRGQFESAKKFYRKTLEWTLHHRRWVLGGALGLFLLSIVIISFMGTEFMPAQDQDMIFMKVRMPVGTSLEETNRVVTGVENLMAQQLEVSIVTAQAGLQSEENRAEAMSEFSTNGPHEGLLWVGLVNRAQRKASDVEVLERIRQRLPKLENVKFEALDISGVILGGTQVPVSIKIYGKELELLKEIADQIVAKVRDVEGVRDLTHTLAKGKPEYQIRIDREKASQLGLTVAQVEDVVQTATQGKVATRYREGSEEIDLRVRFKEKFRNSLDEIKNIPFITPLNKTVYLDQIATIEKGEGPLQITRENQTRMVTITSNIAGRDLGSVVKDIRTRLAGMERQLPPGYFIEFGGAYEQMRDAFLVLAGAFALAVLLIYMVMASQFENFLHPFVIMFTIPLSVIGVVVALMISRRPVNLPVMVGFILLGGIAVANGIVMVDYINQLIRRGIERREAILQGAATRLRPVLLTALATILGMIPMAITTSSGAEFRSPMAVTVIGGLTATTFLTLFVIPIIYSLVNRISFKKS